MPEVAINKISYTDHGSFARDVYGAATYNWLPSEAAIVLTAHIAGSTNWGKSVDNWRLAGMKADAAWQATRDYTVVTGCECKVGLPDNGDAACMCKSGSGQDYSKKSSWRSFNSINEGMASLLEQLRATRYQSAYALLLKGDPEYLAEVGRNGWYTADPAKVKAGYAAHIPEIRKYIVQDAVADAGGLIDLVATGIIVYVIWKKWIA